ncbi:MAG: hypothetical protein HZB13_02040 [Acidobacteria bacterium]|nr:hypothetical protein [Acidobacteriota bacterium]
MKKSRFCKAGPESSPPNWLRRNGGMGASSASKKFLASSALLRRNS